MFFQYLSMGGVELRCTIVAEAAYILTYKWGSGGGGRGLARGGRKWRSGGGD